MKKLRLALAFVLVLAAFATSAPRAEAIPGCPLYQHCMSTMPGPEGCFCEGFYCAGQYFCGIPVVRGQE